MIYYYYILMACEQYQVLFKKKTIRRKRRASFLNYSLIDISILSNKDYTLLIVDTVNNKNPYLAK